MRQFSAADRYDLDLLHETRANTAPIDGRANEVYQQPCITGHAGLTKIPLYFTLQTI